MTDRRRIREVIMSTRLAKTTIAMLLSAGLFAVPAYAAETEKSGTALTESEAPVKIHGDTECEVKEGLFTVRIKALDTDDKNFHWESYRGDKGDASLTEVLTETDMEEGLAYAGSFRALEGTNGEDTIRLVHTNGFYANGYMDFNVKVEDGKITEQTGGSEEFGPDAEEMAKELAGTWEKQDGSLFLEISAGKENGLDFVVSDGGGRDGNAVYYTMTAYYDCIVGALIYQNGTEHKAAVTGETQTKAGETEKEGNGQGKFGLIEQDGDVAITWQDNSFGHKDDGFFNKVK